MRSKSRYILVLLLITNSIALRLHSQYGPSVFKDTSEINQSLKDCNKLILSGNYSKASIEIGNIFKSSGLLNYPEGEANAQYLKGIIDYNQSKYERCIVLMDSCYLLFSKDNNFAGTIKAKNQKAKALAALNKYDEALKLLSATESEALKVQDKAGLSQSFYLQGSILTDNGMYINAESYFQKSLDIRKELNDSVGIAACLSFLGLNHSYLGNYPKALDYIQKSIVIRKKMNDKRGLANSYLNQYKILYVMKEWEQAQQSEFQSLKLCTEIKDEQCVSGRLTNIGELYQRLGNYEKALEYHFQALAISRKINIRNREAMVLNNLAKTYAQLKDSKKAFAYTDSALTIREQIKDNEGIADSYLTRANLYYEVKDYPKSIQSAQKCLDIAEKLKTVTLVLEAHQLLSSNYHQVQDYRNAFIHFDRFISIRDSIYNIETSQALTKKRLSFEFDQLQKIEQLEQDKKDVMADKAIQEERFIRNTLFIGLGIVVLFLFIVFRSNILKKRLNKNLRELNSKLQDQAQELEIKSDKIEQQHSLIETKNKEITDSIYYAKNIQSALMPRDDEFSKYFTEHFIYFKPKDIISGDFYWISEKDEKIIFVTADCTGHGIPGGFMSMLGISLLNEIINEYALTEPALVMSKLRKKLIATLKQKGHSGEQQDGMDLSFLVLDKTNMQLNYSTANHTFYILRTVDGKPTLLQFKGDKQPVGIYAGKVKPFSQTTIDVLSGDIIYTMSDGYADQFGGPKGKKFKYRQLESLLLETCTLPLSEQLKEINKRFEEWKAWPNSKGEQKNLEQIDDVCIIGIRL